MISHEVGVLNREKRPFPLFVSSRRESLALFRSMVSSASRRRRSRRSTLLSASDATPPPPVLPPARCWKSILACASRLPLSIRDACFSKFKKVEGCLADFCFEES